MGFIDSVVKIQSRHQITIPSVIRKAIGLDDKQLFKIIADEDTKKIILEPIATIPEDQKYFWTEEWQKEEKLVEKEIREGKLELPKNIDEVLKGLK